MKYVKVFDEKMMPIGVIDIENGTPQSGQYVKLYNEKGEQVGIQELVAQAPEGAENIFMKVYDENLKQIGTMSVSGGSPSPEPEPEPEPEPTTPAFTSVKVNGSTVGDSSTTEVTIADDTAAVVVEGTDTEGKYLCIKVNNATPQYKAFTDGAASDSVTVADDDVLSFAIGTYADSTFTAEVTFGGTATMKAAEENGGGGEE